MPEITELLDRTTPRDLPPVDVGALARRGRRRQARQRAALAGTMAVVLVVVVLGGAALLRPDDSAEVSAGALDTTEPVGTWSQAADPPFAARTDAFGATLSDGRILIWGGLLQPGEAEDGGIYDPATDAWEPIPPTPEPIEAEGAVRVAGDRLAVVALGRSQVPERVWIYDVAEGRWVSSPLVGELGRGYLGLLWDGDIAALYHLEATSDAGEPGDDRPSETLRWHFGQGQDEWQAGAPAPLSPRVGAGLAFDGTRLAVWGGTTEDPVAAAAAPDGPPVGEVLADGALYLLREDRWVPLPQAPLSGRLDPAVMWWDGRLVVGGGQIAWSSPESGLPPDEVDDLVAYDPASDAWDVLPPAPDAATFSPEDQPHVYMPAADSRMGPTDFVRSGDWFLTADGWEPLSLHDLHNVGSAVLAASTGTEPGAEDRFSVQVWFDGGTLGVPADTGEWLAAPEAPFGAAWFATTVVSGNKLLVVGGSMEDGGAPVDGAWVLDLAQD